MAAIGLLPSTGFWIAVVMFFLTGFTNPLVNGPLLAVVQAVVSPEMQGRVFTLIVSISAAMTPIGLIAAGPIADQVGVQSWYLVGGVVTSLLGVAAFFIPAIIEIEDRQEVDKSAVAASVGVSPLAAAPLESAE